ncbi:hypothetical protein L6164_029490 [Bauhinia variegata]|uniref:Uncharacterized protein n=1 Tax=Bauhinia variegata TaxID=167791 RepID=A0ACB9L9Y7_BAUVA|nr:hypothetical protein L6164_029490 [Bauhinia variegata]
MISGMKVRLEKAHAEIDRILGSIISDHRSRKGGVLDEGEEDLVDVLLQFQQQNDLEVPLTDDNIKAVILDIFAGGSETSASVLVWAMSEMLKNPKNEELDMAESFGAAVRKKSDLCLIPFGYHPQRLPK